MSPDPRSPDLRFAVGVARAFGGALFFALPLLMTMEMWRLGFTMDPLRLAVFTVLFLPLLVALALYSGFEEDQGWRDAALDGLVGYGVGWGASCALLALFGLLEWGMPAREIVGKVSLQAVPAAFGAVLASSQLGGKNGDAGEEAGGGPGGGASDAGPPADGYGVEILYMIAGALFFAFNVAPTEEMVLIAYKISRLQAVTLVVVSLALMHAFVYAVEFSGTHAPPDRVPWWSLFLRFTVVGYALALVVSAYVLWMFGRFDDHAGAMYAMETVVLAFPAALGAAAARLVL